MTQDKKGKQGTSRVKCPKKAFAGLFMLTSGVAIWLNLAAIKVFDFLSPERLAASVQVAVTSVLILWIAAGLWLLLYGLIYPCSRQPEF